MGDFFDEIAGNVAAAPAAISVPQGDFFDQISGNQPGLSPQPAITPAPMSLSDSLLSMGKDAAINVWGGVKKAPSAAVDLVTSIPSGISNLAHLPGDLTHAIGDAGTIGLNKIAGIPINLSGTPEENAAIYGRLERTFRGIGGLSATVAGGGTPLGAIVGGAAGATAFNETNQATGSDVTVAPKEELKNFEENIGVGALLGAVLKGTGKAVGGSSELANSLDRKSLGTRASDYGSTADLGTIITPSGIPETYVKAALNDLVENGKLGTSRDPGKLLKKIDTESTALSTQIGKAIDDYDQLGTPAPAPQFSNALQFIYDGSVPANEIPAYIKRLDELDKGIVSNGGGKLAYLQQQKIAIGKNYSTVDEVKAGFERQIYKDLQTTIESQVPDVGPLNAELAKFITVKPIINRSLKASENASPLSKLSDLTFTTGGIGLPALLGTVLGGPTGTAIGAGVGATLKAAKTPAGQALAARVLRGGSEVAPILNSAADPLIAAVQAESANDYASSANPGLDPQSEVGRKLSAVLKDGSLSKGTISKLASAVLSIPEASAMENMGTKMPQTKTFNTKVADIAKDLDADPAHLLAVMNFETGGELSSTTKNKAGSGATGLIQFMPSTAKALTGASTKEAAIKILSDMTPTEQLDYVKKYLEPFKGKLDTLDDVYMAVLYPKAVGKDSDYALFKEGTTSYWQNRGLDIDGDGIVTKMEAANRVRKYGIKA